MDSKPKFWIWQIPHIKLQFQNGFQLALNYAPDIYLNSNFSFCYLTVNRKLCYQPPLSYKQQITLLNA